MAGGQDTGATMTSSTPTSSQKHQGAFLQPCRQDPDNIMIPSLHPVLSQQNVWETWNRSRHEQMHQTITSENDDDHHDPHAHVITQNVHENARWGQLDRDYNDFHDDGNDAQIQTWVLIMELTKTDVGTEAELGYEEE
jgi:hypothetical protein